jgi:hypothetical protein
MSYVTNYALEHNVPEEDLEDIRDMFEMFDKAHIFDNLGGSEDPWYDHEPHLIHITSVTGWTFTLTGIGEAAGDMWKKRFRGGEVEEVRAEIVWPEFEELTDE